MIAGFFGIMSSGKGVVSTKFLRWINGKYPKKIIANCWLDLPSYTRLNQDELYLKTQNPAFFKDSYLYITELHQLIDARRANSLMNTKFTMFLSQVGKVGCDLIYDSQLFDSQIDLRMREFTTLRFVCERYILKDGRIQDATFEPRISKYPIAIKLFVDITKSDGSTIRKSLGYYMPQQEDYNFYKTKEIIFIDREKHKAR